MNGQEITGNLADGRRYRATAYLLEVSGDGAAPVSIDRADITSVVRKGQLITIKQRKGSDIRLDGATLDDAGRLEQALKVGGTVVSAPLHKGGGVRRFLTFGCGGLIALFVLLVIIVAVSGGGNNDTKQTQQPTQIAAVASPQSGAAGEPSPAPAVAAQATPAPTRTTAPAATPSLGANGALAPGTQIKVGNVVLTLNAIVDPYVSANQFLRAKAGERYVAIDVTLTNDGSGTYDFNTLFDWKAQDAEAFTYSASIGGNPDPFLGTGKLQSKGDQARGYVGFAVKEGADVRAFIFKSLTSTNQGKFERR